MFYGVVQGVLRGVLRCVLRGVLGCALRGAKGVLRVCWCVLRCFEGCFKKGCIKVCFKGVF